MYAKSKAPFLSLTTSLFLVRYSIKPCTPPEADITVIKPPTKNEKIIVLVIQPSEKIATISSKVIFTAAKNDQSVIIIAPEKIPRISEIKTCLVVKASRIAIIGGKILHIPYSILFPPLIDRCPAPLIL